MRIHIQFLLSFRICFVFHCVTSKENECIPLLSPFLFSFRRTVLSHPVSNYFDSLSFFTWKDCAFTSFSKLFWLFIKRKWVHSFILFSFERTVLSPPCPNSFDIPKKRNEGIPLFFFLFFYFSFSFVTHSFISTFFGFFFFWATGLQPAKASCKDTIFSHSNCMRPPCNLGKNKVTRFLSVYKRFWS